MDITQKLKIELHIKQNKQQQEKYLSLEAFAKESI
jgi:hypothetical protein